MCAFGSVVWASVNLYSVVLCSAGLEILIINKNVRNEVWAFVVCTLVQRCLLFVWVRYNNY